MEWKTFLAVENMTVTLQMDIQVVKINLPSQRTLLLQEVEDFLVRGEGSLVLV